MGVLQAFLIKASLIFIWEIARPQIKMKSKLEIGQAKSQSSSALVDSAPGHQEAPKPPSGGFFIWSLLGLNVVSLGYPHHELSFKRTNQLFIPASADVVLNDKLDAEIKNA